MKVDNTDVMSNKCVKDKDNNLVYNTDVISNKCGKDKDNNLVLGDKEKLRVWNHHYEQLLNVVSIEMIIHNNL